MASLSKQIAIPDVTEDSVELLRQILTSEQQREVTYIEAADVGNSLVEFYELLAGDIAC